MSNFNGLNVTPNFSNENSNYKQSTSILGILRIFTLILLLFSLIGSLRSAVAGYTFSFTSFLEFLSNAPKISPQFSLSQFIIGGDWGLFDFLRTFFNFFAKIFGFASWFTVLIWNAIEYVAYFFSFIFAIG